MNYENLLSHGEPIVIYMHGNSGTRANDHRIQLYHVLQNIDCHVIAVDYRSMLLIVFSWNVFDLKNFFILCKAMLILLMLKLVRLEWLQMQWKSSNGHINVLMVLRSLDGDILWEQGK